MKYLVLALFFFSTQSFAGMHEMYDAQVKKEMEAVTAFGKEMKLPKPAGCTEIADKTLMTCFTQQLQKFVITSSSQVYPLIRLGTEVAERDAKARTYDEATRSLVESEAILIVMEQVKPTKFKVNELRPLGTLAEMELKQIKKEEEKTLQTLINQQVIDIVNKKLKNVEKIHTEKKQTIAPDLVTWQTKVLAETKLRMEKMRVMRFLLP